MVRIRTYTEIIDGTFLSAFFGFCLGCIGIEQVFVSRGVLWVAALCAAALFLLSVYIYKQHFILVLLGSFMLAVPFGAIRMEHARPNAGVLDASTGTRVSLAGVVSNDPVKKESGLSFTLALDTVSVAATARDRYADIRYGDEVRVQGSLEKPENFMTDQGAEFDYVGYLYKDSILFKIPKADVVVLSRNNGNPILAALIRFNHAIIASFRRLLSVKEASLLGGLVLGAKGDIDPEFRNALVATGTIHVIALSGTNVTIVATVLRKALAAIPRLNPLWGNALGGIAIVLFVTMTGLQSSAIRSGIMAVIGLFARSTGRTSVAFRTLVLAAAIMILWDPKYLVYDVSFQLSFLATLGLIFITPILARFFQRVPEKIVWFIPIREMLSATLGAQLAVTPFILYKMGTFSLIALPANIVVLPVIPLSMALGALAGFLGMLSPILAYPFAYGAHLILQYLLWIITTLARTPFASLQIDTFSLWMCIGMYGFGIGLWFLVIVRARLPTKDLLA